MEFEAGRHGLASHLLRRLEDAWQHDGCGVYEANSGHIAWAKHPGYLQLECDGRSLRAGGHADRNDVFDHNGFHSPDADHPLRWLNFDDLKDLCFGADVAAECIQHGLGGDPQAARWLPEFHAGAAPVRPGTVVVVAPLLKAMVATGVVRSIAAGLGAAGPVAILDQLGHESLGVAWPDPVDARDLLGRHHNVLDDYVHLQVHAPHGDDFTGHLATALDTVRIIDELRGRGISVVVHGYWLLPDNAWQYRELGRRIGDRLVVVATDRDVDQHLGRDTLEQLLSPPTSEDGSPLADIRMVTYADGHGPGPDPESDPAATVMGWPRFALGDEGVLAHAETWTSEEQLTRFVTAGLPAREND